MSSPNLEIVSLINCARRKCGRHLALFGLAVLGGAGFATIAVAQNVAPVDTLVFEGQTLSGSTTFGGAIANLSINENGEISFFASTSTGQEGVFGTTFGSSTTPDVLVLEGAASPDGGIFSFNQVSLVPSPINAAGQTSFSSDTGGITSQFVADAASGVSLVASGNTLSGIQVRSLINDQGQVLVSADSGATANNLILFNSDGSLSRNVATFGQTLPGIGGTIDLIPDNDFVLNNSGLVAFEATSIDSATFTTDSGLFVENGTQIVEVVREGSATPLGGTFSSITSDVNINDSGNVVFRHNINLGPGGTPTIFSANTSSGSTVLNAVVQEGEAAPTVGGGTNGTFVEFNNIFVNNVDQIVFEGQAEVGTADVDGLFLYDPVDGLQAIFREGDLLPGETSGGLAFGGAFDADVLINDLGQIVFGNSDVNGEPGNSGLFFFDPVTGEITTIAIEGDSIAGLSGTISSLSLDDNSFNNSGQLVFEFLTTEGVSGIATFDSASLTAVPEPSSLGLFALVGLTAVCRRRKR